MKVAMATSGGHPGRANEDFVGAVADSVVLLDGAGIPGAEALCRHGVAWYTHSLGGALLGRLSRGDGQDLGSVLAESIDEIAGRHRHTCDIANPSSPQATVMVLRVGGEHAEYLALAESYLLVDRGNGARVITDEREVAVRNECLRAVGHVAPGDPLDDRVRRAVVQLVRARRNQPGGYWIARDDPRSAGEAVTGVLDVADVTAVALLSNGASRMVDPYGLATWDEVAGLLRSAGPDEVIGRVRRVEETPGGGGPAGGSADDATIAYCTELVRGE